MVYKRKYRLYFYCIQAFIRKKVITASHIISLTRSQLFIVIRFHETIVVHGLLQIHIKRFLTELYSYG